jgi:formate/nitrite transporter
MDSSSPPVSTVPLFDAYAPAEVAVRVRDIGVAKARAPLLTLIALAVLAGAFISLGALFYSIAITPGPGTSGVPFGLSRLAGGIAFSLGLVLVVVGGAELFTGNNLLAMAWAAKRVTTAQVVRNWSWVYLGNLMGALGTALLVFAAGVHTLGDGSVGETLVRIARGKVTLDPVAAVTRGMLCNVLVCLAVWLCMAARGVTDKIMAVVFPISAFVACGFEHSVANMFFLPLGMVLAASGDVPISLAEAIHNLFYVTVGNILGGTVLVGLVYWFVYLREQDRKGESV